ncbi:MAG: hypothetical protein H0T46_11760 [Deltaproteobacteria bacterium]|nr:hypothetical protein [Deltaproteobacteria bacterium]
MLSRAAASLSILLLLPAAAACTDGQTVTTSDAARLVAASGPRVVVAASSETEQPSLGCGGGGDPLLGPSVLFVSENSGATYERIEPADTRALVRIGVKAGVFYSIAQGDGASSFSVLSSTDGRTWTELVSRTGVPHDFSLSGAGFAVAHSGGVLSSTDGSAWTDRATGSNLYAPSVAQVGETLVLASPEEGTLLVANGTGWDRRSIPKMQSIWELIPAAGGLLVTGVATLDGETTSAIARVDLATDSVPTYLPGYVVRPVITPLGLLDTSGNLAAIDGSEVGSFAPFMPSFESATVDGNSVQVLRNGTISVSADGGRTFGAPIALPIESFEHAAR